MSKKCIQKIETSRIGHKKFSAFLGTVGFKYVDIRSYIRILWLTIFAITFLRIW
jgi:hypothetical protein